MFRVFLTLTTLLFGMGYALPPYNPQCYGDSVDDCVNSLPCCSFCVTPDGTHSCDFNSEARKNGCSMLGGAFYSNESECDNSKKSLKIGMISIASLAGLSILIVLIVNCHRTRSTRGERTPLV